jgi:hypothetical protein
MASRARGTKRPRPQAQAQTQSPETTFTTARAAREAVRAASAVNARETAVFVKRRRRFEDPVTGAVLLGARKPLAAAFFPHYIAAATARSSSSASTGTLVDRQLTRYARTGKLASRGVTPKSGKPKKPHRLARQVVARLEQEGVVAVGAQVVVRDGMHGHATALDLVGWQGGPGGDGALVQIEVKTGMDEASRSKAAGMLAVPFASMPNATLSHAFLQAAWSQAAARASGIPIARSVVLVVNSTKACRASHGRWTPLPRAVTSVAAVAALRAGVVGAGFSGCPRRRVSAPPTSIQTNKLPWET